MKYKGVSKVISLVVDQDMCTGCGLCTSQCPSKSLQMNWNSQGFLVPELADNCDETSNCIDVCPFNPFPEKEVETEDEIADIFLKSSTKKNEKIGRYTNTYVGYSKKYRKTSSSGGIATYVFEELLNKGIVDAIFTVRQTGGEYEYSVVSDINELLSSSKTRYFPVTLSNVFDKINTIDGKVAVVGIGCFIKAIRLAQNKHSDLKNKIPFLIGIICGGLKSKFYTEYLANTLGFNKDEYKNPEYRIKEGAKNAGDYSFGCSSKGEESQFKQFKMSKVGDMWGTGLFKANACDFCEDVTTELADISLGDAWFSPYSKDPKGTSVVITRSSIAEELILEGISKEKLSFENLALSKLLDSQQGSFNHRHTGLLHRVRKRKKQELLVPPKRKRNLIKTGHEFKNVQNIRMSVRQNSIDLWKESKDSEIFTLKIQKKLKLLKIATKYYHLIRKVKKKLK